MAADIPRGYLEGVATRAYQLDIVLDVERATYSGEVEISLDVKPGPSRSVFYLHAAPGLHLSAPTVNGIPAAIVRDKSSPTHVARIELAERASPCSGATAINVEFAGCISKTRTDGIYMMLSGGASKKMLCGAPDEGQRRTIEDEAEEEEEQEEEEGEEDDEEEDDEGKGGRNGKVGGQGGAGPVTGDDATGETGAAGASVAAAATVLIGTHLEPTHARELFPCVDLPNSKAVFRLTLRGVPRHLQAISNTPAQCSQDENGTTTFTFQPTPSMPTYVFGFWVGNFHCVSMRASPIAAVQISGVEKEGGQEEEEEEKEAVLINVHVVKGVGLEGAEFALDFARRVFDLFSRLFSVRYPMPKLDLIALPNMHGLGMENFGAITCLQEYLLVTADTAFVRRRRIARLICHEVSHMWYGDIVTPESFDELWLKEGMARFLEYLAVDSLDSSYHVWNNFMSEVFFQAMLADSQEDNHPVVQEHNGDIASILESFDTITYCKGASVLRMLSFCVGHDRFLEGMGALISTHQYGCATQEDLWKAVQGVCDRDGIELNVRDVMQPWLTRPKFPVLRVRVEGGSLQIIQQPFSFFALPDRATDNINDDGAFDPSKAAKFSPPAYEEDGAAARGGGGSEDAGARSPKLPRTGTPVPGGPPLDGSAAAHTRSRPVPAAWPTPLRIRAATGSCSPPESAASAAEGAGGGRMPGDGASGRRRRRRLDEEMFCVLMAEAATSVALPGLSIEPVAAAAGGSAERWPGGERRPYLVVNDGHSGFFTVQYECERSWRLALDAVREGVLNECETMGFVNDLILPLHEGALIDRRAASLSLFERNKGCGGVDGNFSCDVPCLFARLTSVVQLLSRDRSHPAWSTGQLFIWELLIMCASSELGEVYELSRKRSLQRAASAEVTGSAGGGPVASSSPRGVNHQQHPGNTSVETDGGRTYRRNVVADSCAEAGDEGGDRFAGENDEERSGVEDSIAAAAQRLRSITADVEAAFGEAEEHVRWHAERVASGVQQASEALKSLREMRDRLHRSRAQLTWAQRNGVLEEAKA